nr:LytR C-terminal domain-containing protein [Petropleomorpha daqingensis]
MTAKAYLNAEDLDEKGSPRRKIVALVAVAIVALGVLGVYSFVSPDTQQASSGKPATSSSASAPASGIADATLPELSISSPPVAAAPPADVKAPVTVLNETKVTGLAGSIAGQLQAAGWETPATAGYPGSDIAVTTVYYTDGDATQQQAAQALVNAFPQIHGPAVRFFDVPGQPDPGLVVVAAGDWKP